LQKEKKIAKKIRRTLKAHISGMARQIPLKFGIGGAPPKEKQPNNTAKHGLPS